MPTKTSKSLQDHANQDQQKPTGCFSVSASTQIRISFICLSVNYLHLQVRHEGVNTIPHSRVIGVTSAPSSNARPVGGAVVLTLDSGERVTADEVVVAVGIKPNTELAMSAHLEVDPNLVRSAWVSCCRTKLG